MNGKSPSQTSAVFTNHSASRFSSNYNRLRTHHILMRLGSGSSCTGVLSYFVLLGLFGLASCVDSSELEIRSTRNSAADLEPLQHLNEGSTPCEQHFDGMLNSAALGLLQLSHDTFFRNLVIREVQKQFDGDENVLLKDLALTIPHLS